MCVFIFTLVCPRPPPSLPAVFLLTCANCRWTLFMCALMSHNIPVQRFSVCSRKQRGSPAEWSVFHFMLRILEATKGLCLPLPPGTPQPPHTHTFRCHNPVYLFLIQNSNKCVFALRGNRPALFSTNVTKNMFNISIVQTWVKQTEYIFYNLNPFFNFWDHKHPVTQSHDF